MDLNILKLENQMMSEFSLAEEKFEFFSKDVKKNDTVYIEKIQQDEDRLVKVEIENKKILEYMDELLATTVTLMKKTKEDAKRTTTKPDDYTQNIIESNTDCNKEALYTKSDPNSDIPIYSHRVDLPNLPASVSGSTFLPSSSLNPEAQPYGAVNRSYLYQPWSLKE